MFVEHVEQIYPVVRLWGHETSEPNVTAVETAEDLEGKKTQKILLSPFPAFLIGACVAIEETISLLSSGSILVGLII